MDIDISRNREESSVTKPEPALAKIRNFLKHPFLRGILLIVAITIALMWSDMPTYWPTMLSAYIFAALFCVYRAYRKKETLSLGHTLFPTRIWLHPSTIQDFVMTLITFFITVKLLAYIVVDPNVFLDPASNLLKNLIPPPEAQTKPPVLIVALYVLLTVLMSDLFYYISHRLTHRIPFLWEFHKVHHSGKSLTPLTVYRIHPLDMWFNQCFRNSGIGLVSGLFFYFYPSHWSLFVIAGTATSYYLVHVLLKNLQHSHIWISFGKFFEHIFISPAQHQIHHSTNPKHFDKNYGSLFSLWDWMFGSLYVTEGEEDITYGLGDNPEDEVIHASIWKMYVHPIKNLFLQLTKRG